MPWEGKQMTPLFPSRSEAVVFWGILALYFVTVLIWVARHRKTEGKRRRDFVPLILLAIVVVIAIGYARIGVLPHWLFYPGELLFIAGSLFTLWSYSLLGRYLSPYVQVMPEHKVIEAGPYRHIRHPGYLGQIVAYVGLGLALQSWVALLAILTVAGSVLAYRIRLEEEFMATELGDRYVDYMARTKRLLPFVW
jgi:protein-S-isoprenylcysteine O-methyltransferase Ste14